MSVEMAQLLLENGADLNSLESAERITPIHEVVVRGRQELVEFFVLQGADLNTGALKDGDLTYFVAGNMVSSRYTFWLACCEDSFGYRNLM